MNSFLTNHHNSRAYAILFTWIKVITLFDYCGIDIQPVKFGTPNAPQFDIDPYSYLAMTSIVLMILFIYIFKIGINDRDSCDGQRHSRDIVRININLIKVKS